MTQKNKNIINWILAGVVGLIFTGSGIGKLSGGEEAAQMAGSIGLTLADLKILGAVELISAVLFIIPRTGVLGTLLLAAYMGGAMATHLEHGLPVWAPAIIQAIIWIVAVIRFPELRSRLFNKA